MAEKINITLLGTGSSVPTAKRNHLGIMVDYKAEHMLFDCGEGIQRQFRKARKNPMKLTKLFISHWHGDHILGIPGLLNTLQLNNYNKTLEVYGPKGTKKYMNLMMKIFVHREKIKVKVHEIDKGIIFKNKDFVIVSERMDHTTKCLGYSLIEKGVLRLDKKKLKKLKITNKELSKLQKLKAGKDVTIDGKKLKAKDLAYSQNGKKITFISDTKKNPRLWKFAKDSDLLISESTFFDERHLASEKKHLTSIDAAQIAKKAKVGKLILVHISQRHEKNEQELLKNARKVFKNTFLGEDLMELSV